MAITSYSLTIENTRSRYYVKTGSKSNPRVDTPLPYKTQLREFHKDLGNKERTVASIENGGTNSLYNNSSLFQVPGGTTTYNRAYSKLVDKIRGGSGSAQLGTGLVEIRQSAEMVRTRSLHLARGLWLLREGRFLEFAHHFKVARLKSKHTRLQNWEVRRDWSGLWLEYWMGWAPTVGDIAAAAGVLTRDSWADFYKVRAGSKWEKHQPLTLSYGNLSERHAVGGCRVEMGGIYVVDNPMLATAAALGLTNPASILYDVTRFSFLVGWFGNFSQVLNSYTDFSGVRLVDSYTTLHAWCDATEYSRWSSTRWWDVAMHSNAMVRTVGGHPMPKFQFKLPHGLSVTRAATAISLVVSLFSPTYRKLTKEQLKLFL